MNVKHKCERGDQYFKNSLRNIYLNNPIKNDFLFVADIRLWETLLFDAKHINFHYRPRDAIE